MKIYLLFISTSLVAILLFSSCTIKPTNVENSSEVAPIFPDYTDITLPYNIAPLNFYIKDKAEAYYVEIYDQPKQHLIKIGNRNGDISIPHSQWKELLNENKGANYYVDIYLKVDNKWTKYTTITNHIANEGIDSYLSYRIIHPGYEMWNKMGIYQRNLENFNQYPIMENTFSQGNCMNCHSYCNNSPDTMMFHMRAAMGGTVVRINDQLKKLNTKTKNTISAGAYPSWHPSGKYIAFSTNKVGQTFHAHRDKNVEVFDTESNLVVLDLEGNGILSDDTLRTKEYFETFPAWSPDGKHLYFTRATAKHPSKFNEIYYSLMRIGFDENQKKKFAQVEKIIDADTITKSIAFPRVSPDGKHVLFCMSDYGMFTIWHKESDLYLLNIETKEYKKLENVNSDDTESFHSWSKNSRWIVFSSKRLDNLTARPFFAYLDKNGIAKKPFVMPQKDPHFYDKFIKSYNIPELMTGRITKTPKDFARL